MRRPCRSAVHLRGRPRCPRRHLQRPFLPRRSCPTSLPRALPYLLGPTPIRRRPWFLRGGGIAGRSAVRAPRAATAAAGRPGRPAGSQAQGQEGRAHDRGGAYSATGRHRSSELAMGPHPFEECSACTEKRFRPDRTRACRRAKASAVSGRAPRFQEVAAPDARWRNRRCRPPDAVLAGSTCP